MKKVIASFILVIAFIFNSSIYVFAFSSGEVLPTDDDIYEAMGAYALGNLITSGEATELDFSNGVQDSDFLTALGKSIITENPSYMVEYGIDWTGQKVQEAFNSLCQWADLNMPAVYNAVRNIVNDIADEDLIPYYSVNSTEYSMNQFAALLKSRVNQNTPPEPDPDVNYANYLLLLNGTSFFTSGIMADFWFANYDRNTSTNYGNLSFDANPRNYSIIRTEWNYFIYQWDDYSHRGGLLSYFDSRAYHPTYQINNCYVSEPITLYFNNTSGNNYTLTCSVPDLKRAFAGNNGAWFMGNIQYMTDQQAFDIHAGQYIDTYPTLSTFLFTGTLEECFKCACMNFLNVDVYVDGNLWSVGNFESDDIIYPIGIPDSYEIYSGSQGSYYYPPETFWKLQDLIDIIKVAILNAGVVTYNDIAPLIVDVNGQQAIATLNLTRTDYDSLIIEQYPISINNNNILKIPTTFEDPSNVEAMTYIIQDSGAGLLPNDLKIILAGGGIIILIGFFINRMLE